MNLECPNCGSDELKDYVNVDSPVIHECLSCGHHWIYSKQKENKEMSGNPYNAKEEKKKLNWDKPLRTDSLGLSCRLLCKNLKHVSGYAYVVAVENGIKYEHIICCREDGHSTDGYDIENVPEKRTGWINIYAPKLYPSKIHKTKLLADNHASSARIARIKLEYEEGQFDE